MYCIKLLSPLENHGKKFHLDHFSHQSVSVEYILDFFGTQVLVVQYDEGGQSLQK